MTNKRRALFLDRDGVINVDYGYISHQERFEFVEGIFDLCRKAIEFNYLVLVVTNQAGIGRGYYTERHFHELTDWMCQEFLAQGVIVERVYFCPFHPEHGLGDYRRESIFRKPGPGMILDAAKEYELDLTASVLVGDKPTDIQAGLAAGVGCNVLYCPVGDTQMTPSGAFVVSKLLDVKNYLVSEVA